MLQNASSVVIALSLALSTSITAMNQGDEGSPVATGLRIGEQVILLDQDWWLTLATAITQSFEVHARYQVAERYAFTAPSMVGSTLFVRDRKIIQALDLGPQEK